MQNDSAQGESNWPIEHGDWEALNRISSWEELSSHCLCEHQLITEEDEIISLKTQEACNYLSSVFPKLFTHREHPLTIRLSSQTNWTAQWLCMFYDAILSAQKSQGGNPIIKKLRDEKKYPEAWDVLRTGYRFFSQGFSVEYEPTVLVKGVKKIPDLSIQLNSHKLYVEVSQPVLSQKSERVFRTMFAISKAFHSDSAVFHSCIVKKAVPESDLANIEQQVTKLVADSLHESCMKTLEIPELKLAVAPKVCEMDFRQWCTANESGLYSCRGPGSTSNEIHHTVGRILREQQQLPTDFPSIVFIVNPHLTFMTPLTQEVTSQINERLTNLEHLWGTAISCLPFPNCEDPLRKDTYYLIHDSYADFSGETILLLKNTRSKHNLPQDVEDKLVSAFGQVV